MISSTISPNTKETLRELACLFRHNIAQYQSVHYNEANTRTDFIDKFFELLGWDVRNTSGKSEQYRDVIREDHLIMDNRHKAPDYVFRIGKERKFFVEAKKPSVNLHDTTDSAFQLRRYGYTAKMSLSILTNFAEFAVYDTRIKPHKDDKAGTARIFYCTFENYLAKCPLEGYETNFDYIASIFTKNSIENGSFDLYVQSNKNKKGTTEVDDDILALVEDWRLILAKNIAKRNPTLDTTHLNTAVQRIVDRILFLRIAEDRRIERDENLLDAAKKQSVYQHLQKLFIAADEKYNAGLFRQEKWLNHLVVDDKILSPIIKGLYYPESPYAFAVLPIEILGNIYERFLGKTIILSPNHVAKVEEKPEVRKAGGVYYTPQYIVNYIVEETVGCKLADYLASEKSTSRRRKSPDDTAGTPPTILDPACGSGSFLVGAYTFLLDSYLTYYSGEHKRKDSLKSGVIYEVGKDTYRISIEEKQRILLTSIYGVDIDPIAVEVTKLSLYLKLLENETDESAGLFFKHSDLKMLPDLDKNIRCGNSLVESDFYRNKEMPLFGDAEIRRINAFDWEKEFSMIFQNGGFDCVIGNPPYVFARDEGFTPSQKEYFYQKFKLTQYQLNTYIMFAEQALNLSSKDSVIGFIMPNNWMTIDTTSKFREFVLKSGKNIKIVNSRDKVFQAANVDTSILVFSRQGRSTLSALYLRKQEYVPIKKVAPALFVNDSGSVINFERLENKELFSLCQKIEKHGVLLDTIAIVKSGIVAYEVGKGVPVQTEEMQANRIYHSQKPFSKNSWYYLDGVDIARYQLGWSGQYIQYGDHLAAPRKKELFEENRILVRQIPANPPYSVLATYVNELCINDRNSMIVKMQENKYSIFYVLAILNSRLMSLWFNAKFGKLQRKLFPQFKIKELSQFPIPPVDFSDKKQKAQHDKLVTLVNQMLSAQERLRALVSDADRKTCTERVKILDRQIDTIVYELYGLTEADIEIAEGKN